MSIPHQPIKNDSVDRISKDASRSRRTEPKEDKFQAELDSARSAARLKKHSKSLDSETDEELGKIKDEVNEQVSLFDLSAADKKKSKLPSAGTDNFMQTINDSPGKNSQGMLLPENENLLTLAANTKAEKGTAESVAKLQQLVEKMIQAIQQMELKGKTDTIVTLTHPPMFKGANIVLTSFESAKGEYNIAFENLTQRAKTFLDSNQNLDVLKMHLEQKGYITHIITTSTVQEHKPYIPGQPEPRGEERGQQRQQQQQQQHREKEK